MGKSKMTERKTAICKAFGRVSRGPVIYIFAISTVPEEIINKIYSSSIPVRLHLLIHAIRRSTFINRAMEGLVE